MIKIADVSDGGATLFRGSLKYLTLKSRYRAHRALDRLGTGVP